jgi:hypothetical protein
MGLDIKTFGEGKKVYAVAEGSLARIKISQYGYGKALYVNHPGGYTSLYAHLSRFSPRVEKFVREQQYKMKMEEIDITIPDSVMTFYKGEIIAYSGNTGSSEGPHLHFEIRDTKTEVALDPLQYKIPITDTRAPDIYGIKIYPVGTNSHVNGKNAPAIITHKKNKNGIVIESTLRCTAAGKIALGVHTNDYMNESGNRNGIYEITVQVNGADYFKQRLDQIDFAATRYINTYMDYNEYHDHSRHIHKCYKYGNNKLDIYQITTNNGFIDVTMHDSVAVTVIVKDGKGNTKKTKLNIIGENKTPAPIAAANCTYKVYYYDTLKYNTGGLRLHIEPGTVYDSACIEIEKYNRTLNTFSPIHKVEAHKTPLQEYYTVGIKVPDSLNFPVEKLFIGWGRENGWRYNKSLEVNGYVCAQVRDWGRFALVADTVAPVINVDFYKDSMLFNGNRYITYQIRDNFGLQSVNAYVDGEWVLMPYDKKKGKHVLYANELMRKKGYRNVEIIAVDVRDNKTTWKGIIKTE